MLRQTEMIGVFPAGYLMSGSNGSAATGPQILLCVRLAKGWMPLVDFIHFFTS